MPDGSLRPARAVQVLLAEDEPHIRRVLTSLLESAGFEVQVARNGREALDHLLSERPFDLVLSDLMMPEVTGIELLRAARELPARAGTPIVILTAKGQDVDRREALSLGAADFITKPFSPRKLLTRVDEILAER